MNRFRFKQRQESPGCLLAWLHSHAFRMLLAMIVIVANSIEWVSIPPVFPQTLALSSALMILAAATVIWPRAAGWAIVFVVAARTFVLDLSGPNPLWGVWLALVLIGYHCALRWAVAAFLIVTVSQCIPLLTGSYTALAATWVGMVNYIGSFIFATLIGVSFRWRSQRDASERRALELERQQWELNTLKRNTEIASRIHNSASGGLSAIALTAQRQLRQLRDTDDIGAHNSWRFVNDQALGVLNEVHKVIDLLEVAPTDNNVYDSDIADEQTSQNRMIDALDKAHEQLEALGYSGTFTVNGSLPRAFPDPSAQAAIRLIGETTANIARHMNAGSGKYRIVVTLNEHAIAIMETNPISDHGNSNSHKTAISGLNSHGSGLRLHREIIESLGGELNTSDEDGEWVLYARIPAHGSASLSPER